VSSRKRPALKPYLELLESQKSHQNATSLAIIWSVNEEEARTVAGRLVEIGFFEQHGDQNAPTFWVPFIYRPPLRLVQGSAEGVAAGEVDEDGE